jgi:hypothetical protein
VALLAVVVGRSRPGWARRIEVGAATAGVLTLVFGGLAWGDGSIGAITLLAELAGVSAAIGGVFAAMILGHWYLVTPKLPESPLILLSRILLAILAAQIVMFGVWTALAAGPAGGPPFNALTGDWALFVWLRLIIGLVFPLVVSWAAVQTARTRSMESATGLLYINVTPSRNERRGGRMPRNWPRLTGPTASRWPS